MKNIASRTIPLNEATHWQADKRLLPSYMHSSDNSRRIASYKRALQKALDTRVSAIQREQLLLFYEKRLTKTQIGQKYGVGSSTVCKTLKAAEQNIREYVELYMQIYDLLEYEHINEDNEYNGYGEICGG